MSVRWLTIALLLSATAAAHDGGVIEGVVVNASGDAAPLAKAEVVLRAGEDGFWMPVAQTVTDEAGRFVFHDLPVEQGLVYLPGVNRQGVHYPGPRVNLHSQRPTAHVRLSAFDAVAAPSPLMAQRHVIQLHVQAGVLEVCETLLVTNPSQTTYIGKAQGDAPPVTLRICVPEGFERVTFDKEFHGRRFSIVDNRLVTSIPWPPGEQELKFTYRLPIDKHSQVFRRALDVPAALLQVRVAGKDADQASCNLPLVERQGGQGKTFQSDKPLPAGFSLEVACGRLPIPWMIYARCAAVAVLGVLVSVTVVSMRLRKKTLQAGSASAGALHSDNSSRPARSRKGKRARTSRRRAA
jgi:hypothetical protein